MPESFPRWLVAAVLAAIVMLVIVAVPTTPAQAATFTVDSAADVGDEVPGDGICLTSGGQCTLRAAIQEANALAGADTIDLPADTYTLTIAGAAENAAAAGDLDITDDLTISGAGAADSIIDGAALDRVLEIFSPATVHISAVTIQNGNTDDFGGGIENFGDLTLADSTISGNTADFGGGIENFGDLTITNSTVTDNTANTSGGLSNVGGATLEVTNSTVSGNTAMFEAGGVGSDGTATLTNSTISGNSADVAAGIGNRGTMSISGSTVSGNTAISDSGGIGNDVNGTLDVTNSTISDNAAELFAGIGNGGATTLTNSTVSGNSAGVSGGIGNGGAMTLTNSTVSGNSAEVSGGIGNRGTMTLTNSTLSGNSATTGGGVFNIGTVTLKNTIVANNSAGGNCSGNITSEGHNLEDTTTCGFAAAGDLTNIDPQLGPLQDNGGPTQTHALLPGSPAIDAGGADCPPPDTDQRGVARPADGDGDGAAVCDIGAYELEAGGPMPTPPGPTATVSALPSTGTGTSDPRGVPAWLIALLAGASVAAAARYSALQARNR